MNKKTIIGLVVVIAVILIIVGINTKKDDGVIKIGFIGPLTGGAASYGELYKAGVQFAYDDLLKNGEKNGKKFQMVYEDGGCDPKMSASAAQKLINVDKVDAIIGGFCSGETMSFIDLANQNKIPVITSGSAPEIAGKSKYVFQSWPLDSYAGKTMSDLVKKNNPKKVVVLSANTTYAIGISDVFVKNFGDVAMYEKFTDSQTDFKDVIAKVKSIDADAIVLNTQTPATLILFAKQLREAGVKSQIYTAYHNGADVLNSPNLAGMITIDAPVIGNDTKNVVKRYKDKTGVDASLPYVLAESYDSLDLFIRAFIAEGKNSDKIIKYLGGVKNFQGLSGTFSFINNQIDGLNLPARQLINKKLVDLK